MSPSTSLTGKWTAKEAAPNRVIGCIINSGVNYGVLTGGTDTRSRLLWRHHHLSWRNDEKSKVGANCGGIKKYRIKDKT